MSKEEKKTLDSRFPAKRAKGPRPLMKKRGNKAVMVRGGKQRRMYEKFPTPGERGGKKRTLKQRTKKGGG